MAERVAALGYVVAGRVSSALEAADLVKKLAPDVVLVGMGGERARDGLAEFGKIWKDQAYPAVLVLETQDDQTLAQALATCQAGIVIEPFSDMQLKAMLESARKVGGQASKRRVLEYDLGVHRHELEQQNEELRLTRDDLEVVRDKYHHLYDFAPVGYVSLDEKGFVLEANLMACTMLGVERVRLIGDRFAKYMAEESTSCLYQLLMEAARGSGHDCEAALKSASGSVKDVYIVSMPVIGQNGATVNRAALLDITARKNAEQAFQASEAMNQKIIESSLDCIKVLDLQGRITFASAKAKNLLELADGGSDSPQNFPDLWPAGGRDKASLALESAREGRTASFEAFRPTAGGKIKWWDVNVTPIFDQAGEVERLLAISRDVTESKENREALQRAKEVAESANTAKSEFLAMMSHEIRTPMNGVLGMAELILRTEKVSDKTRNYLQLLQQSGQSLLAIINDILDFSMIESGRVELNSSEFSVREFLASVLAPHVITAEGKGLSLDLAVTPDVPESLVGDQRKLRQIITNLVGNAIKFTSKGGVSVSVTQDPTPRPEAVRLIFSVSDTGIGIAKEHQNTIFDSFRQAEKSTHINYGGTGLGLAIAKNLVSILGGYITVDSEPGRGSTFTFTVSFARPHAPHGVGDELFLSYEHHGRLRVLLAEDNTVNQLVTTEFLETLGHETDIAGNGLEALEKLKAKAYDLVLMDVRMPEMDGLAAVAAVRAGEAGRENVALPVVALTAHALNEDQEQFLKAGMDDCLSKPFSLDDLDQVLDKAMTLKKAG
jgi:two-component system CheB/CheR fusion protein